jgi:uncharacterized membrane protein YobD (UPF0266 family)
MNDKEYYIRNKSPLISSMSVAGVFIIFELFIWILGANPLSEWGMVEFIFLPLSILIITVDTMDLVKIKNNKLMVRIEDEGVRILSYVFSNKFIPYAEMTAVNLREKDIEYVRNGKRGIIAGPTQSDLIRIMKQLSDKING